MIDRKTESDIHALNSFLEFWMKFHSIYVDITGKEIITKDEEDKFLETKATIRSKYDELKGSMEFKYVPHGRLTDPVNEILDLYTVRFISEKNLKKVNDDWNASYIFLNNILERLKNKKKRLEQFNPVGVYFKRIFNR